MKHMNESERMLAVFGIVLTCAALILSLGTEITARRRVAEYRQQVAAGFTVALQSKPIIDHHIGYDQQTLASRWSVPDGHGTLGLSFAAFGVLLITVPRATARKRAAST